VLVGLVYVVIQVVVGNMLVPMVMKSTIGVPPFPWPSASRWGAATGGLVGAPLAVPFVAALVVIPERAQDREKMVTLEGRGGADAPSGQERGQMETVAPSQPQPPAADPGV
jgi:predicted PurR-regulated permease PerM